MAPNAKRAEALDTARAHPNSARPMLSVKVGLCALLLLTAGAALYGANASPTGNQAHPSVHAQVAQSSAGEASLEQLGGSALEQQLDQLERELRAPSPAFPSTSSNTEGEPQPRRAERAAEAPVATPGTKAGVGRGGQPAEGGGGGQARSTLGENWIL